MSGFATEDGEQERGNERNEANELKISVSLSNAAEEKECGNTDSVGEVKGDQRFTSEDLTTRIVEEDGIDSQVQGYVTELVSLSKGEVPEVHHSPTPSPPPPLPVTPTEDLEDDHHYHALHHTVTLSPTQLEDIGNSVLDQTAWSTTTHLDLTQALLSLPPQHRIDGTLTWRDPIPLMPPTPPPGSSQQPLDSSGTRSSDESLLESISSSVLEETQAEEDAAVGEWRDYLHIVHPSTLDTESCTE
ncbi:uncharacterized protein LOC135115430 [Scylla paramamosain]|uniref:uncharacterized protein LOC135115430 n=1 Tax=Scylla paramamosain TaxID=85552 RepID=UPI00308399C8